MRFNRKTCQSSEVFRVITAKLPVNVLFSEPNVLFYDVNVLFWSFNVSFWKSNVLFSDPMSCFGPETGYYKQHLMALANAGAFPLQNKLQGETI